MSDESGPILVKVETGESQPVTGDKGDVDFPPEVRGWGDVLDCRHSPFDKRDTDQLRDYAAHIHKHYLLING